MLGRPITGHLQHKAQIRHQPEPMPNRQHRSSTTGRALSLNDHQRLQRQPQVLRLGHSPGREKPHQTFRSLEHSPGHEKPRQTFQRLVVLLDQQMQPELPGRLLRRCRLSQRLPLLVAGLPGLSQSSPAICWRRKSRGLEAGPAQTQQREQSGPI